MFSELSGRSGMAFPTDLGAMSKLYIPSTLNIDLILWHPQLIVDAVKLELVSKMLNHGLNHGFFLSLFHTDSIS